MRSYVQELVKPPHTLRARSLQVALPLLILALLALVVLAFFAGCSTDEKVIPGVAPVASNDNPSQTSYQTSIRFSTDGSTRAILFAHRIRTYESQRFTLLDSGVRVDFYDKMGLHSSRLISSRARINDITHDMTAYDSVHIVSDSGTIVDTDSLEWHNKSQTLHSEARVRIAERNGRVTTGIGFESDQNLTSYRILHTMIIAPKDALGTATPGTGTASNARTQPLPQSNFGAPEQDQQNNRPFGQPKLFGLPKNAKPPVDSAHK